jgi:hypothetical protein
VVNVGGEEGAIGDESGLEGDMGNERDRKGVGVEEVRCGTVALGKLDELVGRGFS